MEREDITEEQAKLRSQLRLLAEKLNDDMYQQRQRIFGRVATIVEAAIADAEQRKSIKDLISEAIYGSSYWNGANHQLEQLASANGFDLNETIAQGIPNAPLNEPVNQYAKV